LPNIINQYGKIVDSSTQKLHRYCYRFHIDIFKQQIQEGTLPYKIKLLHTHYNLTPLVAAPDYN